MKVNVSARTVTVLTHIVMAVGPVRSDMALAEETGDVEGFDAWEAMNVVTQETRASLIADIVGHPEGMPSIPELDYANPDVGRSAITEHLDRLADADVIERVEIPAGERSRDLPYVFYEITDEARRFFDRNEVFDRETWQREYAKLEKTDRIERIEAMDRPERG